MLAVVALELDAGSGAGSVVELGEEPDVDSAVEPGADADTCDHGGRSDRHRGGYRDDLRVGRGCRCGDRNCGTLPFQSRAEAIRLQ